MTYEIRWQCSFPDAHGMVNIVNIKDRDYTGAITRVKGGVSPICIGLNGDIDDVYAPIAKTQAALSLVSETKQQFLECSTGDGRRFMVEWIRQFPVANGIGFVDVTEWIGWIATDLYSEQYVSDHDYLVSIIAHDGLGDLESIDYKPLDFLNVTNYDNVSWSYILSKLLERTGLSLNVIGEVAIEAEDSGTATLDSFASTSMKGFFNTNCFEVLEKHLRSAGSCLRQNRGSWEIFTPNYKAKYGGHGGYMLRAKQELSPLPSAKKIIINSDYRYVDWGLGGYGEWLRYNDTINGFDFRETKTVDDVVISSSLITDNIEITDDGLEIPVSIGKHVNMINWGDNVVAASSVQNFVFGLDFDFRFIKSSEVTISGGGLVLTTNGWQIPIDGNNYGILNLVTSKEDEGSKTFKITSEPIPFSGEITVNIKFFAYDKNELPEGYDRGLAIIKDINTTVLDNLSNPKTGEQAELTVNENEKEIYSIETCLASIDKLENYPIRYCGFVYNDNAGVISSKFRLKNSSTAHHSLQELLLLMYAKTYEDGPWRVTCDLYDLYHGFTDFTDLLSRDGRVFIMANGTLDCRSRQFTGCTFVEIKEGIQESIATDISFRIDSDGNTRSTGGNNEYRAYIMEAGVGKRIRDLNTATAIDLNTVIEVDGASFGTTQKATLQQVANVVAPNLSSYARTDTPNTYQADQTINSDLYVNGNIIQNGAAYVTHAQQVKVESNLMQLNLGEPGNKITGVIPGTAIQFSGLEINRGSADPYYFGVVEGANPLIKLGKADSLVTVAAREDSPFDNGVMVWDDANHRMKAVRDLDLNTVAINGVNIIDNSRNISAVEGIFGGSITYGTTIYSPASGGIEFNNFGNIKFKSDATTTNYFHIDSVNGSFLARYYNYGRVEQYYGGKLRTATTLNGFDISGRVGSPDYVSGFAGADWRITKSGFADLGEVNIRKGLTVHELIVARERSVNGGIITSVANGTVKSVNGNVITLKGQYNSWVVGDRVRLQQWEASTRYMEAEVTAVNGMTITLDNYLNATRPQANEDLVQWGHVSDTSRQNFLYQTARGDDAAYFAVMHGVNSSSLTDKQVLRIGNLGGYANAGYGIASKYEGKTYFELSNNVKTIAGIAFDSEKLIAGNVRIWKNGDIINTATGTPYALYNDGSGILAKGNISWDTSGNVTFGSDVKLNWNGGANLFKNSRCIVNGKLANVATNGSTLSVDTTIKYQGEPTMKVIGSTSGFKWLTHPVIEPDTIYTVSMMVRSVVNFAGRTTTPVHIQVPVGGHTYENIISHNMSLVANEWKQIHLTFSSTATTARDMQIYLYGIPKTQVNVAWIKLEKGTGASDWNEPVDVNKLTKITGSGIYTGTLTTAQIIATGIKVGTGGIQLDSSAVISWSNVTGTSGIETTTGSQAKANAAKSSAISSASTDATSKSNSAKTSAISTASLDATAKANDAKSSAISTASTDATNKANSAKSVANTAQSKANSAYSLAGTKITSSQATTITKSTITAAYINAFSLNASSIKAGTLDTDRLNVNDLRARLITADNINSLTLTSEKGYIGGFTIKNNIVQYISGKGSTTSGLKLISGSSGGINLYRNGTSTTSNAIIRFYNGTSLGATLQSINTASVNARGVELVSTGTAKISSTWLLSLVSDNAVEIDSNIVNFKNNVLHRDGGSFGGGAVIYGSTMTTRILKYYDLARNRHLISVTANSPTELSADYDSYFFNATGGSKCYIRMPNPFNFNEGSRILIGTRGRDVTIVASSAIPLNWDDPGNETSNNYTLSEACRWTEWALFAGAWYLIRNQNL